MTPIDFVEVTVPARREVDASLTLACPAKPFEFQISLWRPNGDLVRDTRFPSFPSFRCPSLPQVVGVEDRVDYYRPVMYAEGGAP